MKLPFDNDPRPGRQEGVENHVHERPRGGPPTTAPAIT